MAERLLSTIDQRQKQAKTDRPKILQLLGTSNASNDIDPHDTLSILAKQREHPLLTAEQEKELFQLVEQGKLAKLEASVTEAKEAADILSMYNQRLVHSIAFRYFNRGVPLADLCQQGNIGLTKAIIKFDYKRGYKFSTYATYGIRQAISSSIPHQGRPICLPIPANEQFIHIMQYVNEHSQLGQQPTVKEISSALHIPPRTIKRILHTSSVDSLDEKIISEEDDTLIDIIPDNEQGLPEEILEQKDDKKSLQKLLAQLPQRERQILILRFGTNGREHTLEEIGQQFGLTKEGIRQIEKKELAKLRKNLEEVA